MLRLLQLENKTMANILGTNGNDTLSGTSQDDTLEGGTGNDTFLGGDGIDTAVFSHFGPATDLGDNVLFNGDFVSGRRVEIRLGEGNAAGTATVTTTIPAAVQEQDSLFNIENVTGSNGTETIVGNSQANVLRGLGGHDTLFGGGGGDTIEGGSGQDLIDGGTGNDSLDGGTGSDTLSLESFNSILSPAVFRQTVDLRDGFSSRSAALTNTEPFVEQERDSAINFENVIGSSRDDTIFGTLGNNHLEGRGGNDFIEGRGGLAVDLGIVTLAPRDTLDGGTGTDTVSYAYLDTLAQTSLIMRGTISLASTRADGRGFIELLSQITPTFVTVTDDVLLNFENVRGSNLSETITGNGEANRIEGRGGNDTIHAEGGVDTVLGGTGNDTIDGGRGNDTLAGEAGIDTLDLRSWDTATIGPGDNVFTTSITGAEVRLAESPLSLIPIDTDFSFGMDQATLFGQQRFAIVTTTVVFEQDQISGFENVIGTVRNDRIGGNRLDNRLEGRDGDDLIKAGGGNDTVIGGGGVDRMFGGSGADTFVFQVESDSAFGAADTIVDFQRGVDKIDLSAIDANVLTNADQFTFIGTAAFSGAGQLRAVITGADQVTLLGNTDGDSFAEIAIRLTGDVTEETFFGISFLGLGTGDFIL